VHSHATAAPAPIVVTDEPAAWDADTALEQLYAAHWRSLVRLAVLVVGDLAQAEEITQDAFVAVHARWRRLRDPDKALAYLRQTVVNRSRSVLRHRAVVDRHARATGPTEASATALPGSDEAAVAAERRGRVLAALQDLPDRQRAVMALRYYGGLSEAEIADALGISRGAVKSHASRGAASLRAALTDYLEDRS
jgi:RNA polymerase sigma-70 factor (sigma-E family)